MSLQKIHQGQGPILRVMLLVSSLENGGAERQVIELMRNLDRTRFSPVVCSLSSFVPLAQALPNQQRDLIIVEKRCRFDVTTVPRVASVMKEQRIDIVQAFLFDADIIGRLAAWIAAVPVMIASERNADYRRTTIQTVFHRMTHRLFTAMVANSDAGKKFNMNTLRLPENRIFVVHNGVDVTHFRPIDASALREEWGINDDQLLVGMIANFKRQKNHTSFFRMAKTVLLRFPHARFVCVGEPLRGNLQGAEDYYHEMRKLLCELKLEEYCLFPGNCNDMPQVYSACDLTVLTSSREGTPNVLLESMACEVPVVASNVADNSLVVPNNQVGFVVPLDDVNAMSERVCQLLSDSSLRRQMGKAGREWVKKEFSVTALVERTGTIYETLWRSKMPHSH